MNAMNRPLKNVLTKSNESTSKPIEKINNDSKLNINFHGNIFCISKIFYNILN